MSEFWNPTEDGILQQIVEKRAGNFDIRIENMDEFSTRVDEHGRVFFRHKETELSPSNSALSQMLTRNEIPGSFFNKCPVFLKSQILTTFCDRKKYLLRAGKNDTCRAVMSSSPKAYKPMDDHQIYPIVLDELADQGLFNHKVFKFDPHVTSLTTAVNENNTELPYFACITVTNSETGHSSIWVEPSIVFRDWNLQVSNRDAIKKHLSRFVHRGTVTEADIRDAIRLAKDIAQVGVIQLMENGAQVVTTEEVKEFMDTMDFFPQRFASIVEEEIQAEKNVQRLAVVRSILEKAKELPLIQQIAVEQSTGKFLKLFDDFEVRIQKLTTELSAQQGE